MTDWLTIYALFIGVYAIGRFHNWLDRPRFKPTPEDKIEPLGRRRTDFTPPTELRGGTLSREGLKEAEEVSAAANDLEGEEWRKPKQTPGGDHYSYSTIEELTQ